VNAPLFEKYNRVFDDFNFGLRARAILLSLIYPFERFESLGAFKWRIGATKDEVSSGKSIAWKTGVGSKLCRTELYLWVYTTICGKTNRPQSKTGKIIAAKYDLWLDRCNDLEEIDRIIRARTRKEAIQKAKEAFTKALRPFVPSSKSENFLLVVRVVELSLMSAINDGTSESKLKLNRKEAERRLKNLTMSNTANHAARWLYRLLKRSI
jgi:hypothetical protein